METPPTDVSQIPDGFWPSGPVPDPRRQSPAEPPRSSEQERAQRTGRRLDLVLVSLLALVIGAGGAAAGLLGTDLLEGRITERAEQLVDAALAEFEPVAAEAPAEPIELPVPIASAQLDSDLGQIVANALPSVVQVVVSIELEGPDGPVFEPIGTGSGVGLSGQGHILTNNHVVAEADRIEVVLVDGRAYQAELVGRDELTDVAIIKVAPGLVPPMPLADISELAIGDTAIAVGNPLGLEGGPSVTVGIVSAFDRQLDIADRPTPLQGLIQTDAPISGGSSGGALLDASGRLIGITTAKSVGESAEGLGFAIPINLAVNIADDLIRNGLIDHPFLGIWGQTAYRILDDGATQPAGATIVRVIDGSEADDPVSASAFGDAGALADDVIVAFDGIEIRTMNQLASLMRFYRAGDVVTVTVDRAGERIDLEVTLASRPEGT